MRQRPMRNRRIGCERIIGRAPLAHHGRAGDSLERVVGILHVLKAHALLGGIGRGPARAGTKRIQILMNVEVVERVGRLIDVANPHFTAQHTARLIQRRGDLVRHSLLPIGRIRWKNEEQEREHGVRESRVFWGRVARKGGRFTRRLGHNGLPLFSGGLMLHRTVALAALALVAACVDRIPVTPPPSSEGPPPAASLAPASRRPEGLARMVAKGLKNPAFRAYLKAQLDASPYREHKLQFETFLAANSGRALREVASENSVTKENLAAEAQAALALEVYLPVPAHRAAWQGDEHILVATALTDDDPPIAFDPEGRRQVLDPKIPPSTPVLAIVPVETDFSVPAQPTRPARQQCLIDCGEGGGGGGGSP